MIIVTWESLIVSDLAMLKWAGAGCYEKEIMQLISAGLVSHQQIRNLFDLDGQLDRFKKEIYENYRVDK